MKRASAKLKLHQESAVLLDAVEHDRTTNDASEVATTLILLKELRTFYEFLTYDFEFFL